MSTSLQRLDRHALARAMHAVLIRPDSVADRLAELAVPTLLLAGQQDYVLPDALHQVHTISRAALALTPNGHVGPLEDPVEVTALLKQLLDDLDGSGRLGAEVQRP